VIWFSSVLTKKTSDQEAVRWAIQSHNSLSPHTGLYSKFHKDPVLWRNDKLLETSPELSKILYHIRKVNKREMKKGSITVQLSTVTTYWATDFPIKFKPKETHEEVEVQLKLPEDIHTLQSSLEFINQFWDVGMKMSNYLSTFVPFEHIVYAGNQMHDSFIR